MSVLTVRGQKVRCQSRRRYVAIVVRPNYVTVNGRTYVPFARIEKRSDNLETARTAVRRLGYSHGAFGVVVDTATGEEV